MRTPKLIALVTLALPLVWASHANARQASPSGNNASARVAESADQLEQRATAMFHDPTRYSKAARLLERAAALRTDTDEKGVQDQIMAARLWYYTGNTASAQAGMKVAAERALNGGFIVHALHSFLDAGYVALERRDGASAREFFARAERLANSPHIDALDGEYIALRLAGIHPATAVAGAR